MAVTRRASTPSSSTTFTRDGQSELQEFWGTWAAPENKRLPLGLPRAAATPLHAKKLMRSNMALMFRDNPEQRWHPISATPAPAWLQAALQIEG